MFKPPHFHLTLGVILLGWTQFAEAIELPAPEIEWQRSFGGNDYEGVRAIEQTFDGGFIVGGFTYSGANGNKTSPLLGYRDGWLIRLDSNGNKLWEKAFGGNVAGALLDLKETPDHGFVLVGYSQFQTNENEAVMTSAWVIRLDQNGNKIWDQMYGGIGIYYDYFTRVLLTDDGGFICLGDSESPQNTGNKTSPHYGETDLWLVRLDSTGNKLWEKTFGGSSLDYSACLTKTSEGGFLLGGYSKSGSTGNKTSPFFGGSGFGDYWVIRVNSQGDKLWDYSFGGSEDEFLLDMKPRIEGGFLLTGSSASQVSGNKTTESDGPWLVALDTNGNKEWEKSLNRTNLFYRSDCLANSPNGGFIVGGALTYGPYGGFLDYWAGRMDGNGVFVWNKYLGGDNEDRIECVRQTADGSLLLAGTSASGISGNKTTPNFGDHDWWIVKLKPEQPKLEFHVANPISTNGFEFSVVGISNKYVTEFSTNLFDWINFQTNTISVTPGEFSVIDPNTNGNRFYRARQIP